MAVLPAGLRAAPLTPDDAAAVTAVWQACEIHDDGRAEIVPADIVAFMRSPRLDFERDTVGIRAGDELVAVGVQLGVRLTFVHVLPAWRGRGVGRWLARWSEDAARALGATSTAQTVSEREHAAIALLEAEGYERRSEEWLFEIALEAELPAPVLPPGYAVRSMIPGRDERAAFDVIERAFSEFPERPPRPYDDWAAMELGRPGFEPELLGLAVHGDEVVGAALIAFDEHEGYVSALAVAREHRGRGIARALLTHAFGVVRRRGASTCGLATDGRTGARGLYEHVGMRVRKTYFEYVKQL